jgi:hypothetical protein
MYDQIPNADDTMIRYTLRAVPKPGVNGPASVTLASTENGSVWLAATSGNRVYVSTFDNASMTDTAQIVGEDGSVIHNFGTGSTFVGGGYVPKYPESAGDAAYLGNAQYALLLQGATSGKYANARMSAYRFADDSSQSLTRLPANTTFVDFNVVSPRALGTISFSSGNDDVFAADLDGGRFARVTRTAGIHETTYFEYR